MLAITSSEGMRPGDLWAFRADEFRLFLLQAAPLLTGDAALPLGSHGHTTTSVWKELVGFSDLSQWGGQMRVMGLLM